jgi:hypothetical protein
MPSQHLVNSEAEYLALFREWDVEDAERFLDVEFAYSDGSFQSLTGDRDLSVDMTVYRRREPVEEDDGLSTTFPSSYPCLVLLANDQDFDRTGPTSFEMLHFVYPSDFGVVGQ